MTVAGRLRLVSPFRWRLEWAALLAAAVAGALAEQAKEARLRDPYQIVVAGLSAKASVSAARTETISLGTRRGVPVEEVHTFLDFDWEDSSGAHRRIMNYHLDNETVAGLSIDTAAQRWPARVDILYLDRTAGVSAVTSPLMIEQGVTASSFQSKCRPQEYCRVVVLTPDILTPTEVAAFNVDYVLERAPHAFRLSVAMFGIMLCLRLLGIVHNRPSLE